MPSEHAVNILGAKYAKRIMPDVIVPEGKRRALSLTVDSENNEQAEESSKMHGTLPNHVTTPATKRVLSAYDLSCVRLALVGLEVQSCKDHNCVLASGA